MKSIGLITIAFWWLESSVFSHEPLNIEKLISIQNLLLCERWQLQIFGAHRENIRTNIVCGIPGMYIKFVFS